MYHPTKRDTRCAATRDRRDSCLHTGDIAVDGWPRWNLAPLIAEPIDRSGKSRPYTPRATTSVSYRAFGRSPTPSSGSYLASPETFKRVEIFARFTPSRPSINQFALWRAQKSPQTWDSTQSSITVVETCRDLVNSRKVIATHLRRFAFHSWFSSILSRVSSAQFHKTRNPFAGSSRGTTSERIIFVVNRYSRLAIRFITEYLPAARPCESRLRWKRTATIIARSEQAPRVPAPRPRKRGRSPVRRIPSRFREITCRYSSDDVALSEFACLRKSGHRTGFTSLIRDILHASIVDPVVAI